MSLSKESDKTVIFTYKCYKIVKKYKKNRFFDLLSDEEIAYGLNKAFSAKIRWEESSLKKKMMERVSNILSVEMKSDGEIGRLATAICHPFSLGVRDDLDLNVEISAQDSRAMLVEISDRNSSRLAHKMETKIIFCKAISYFWKNVKKGGEE